jgi:excisionase family DNA binding protein
MRESTINERRDLTPHEVAETLGVARSTVSRWLTDGRLAGWRTAGGHWRVPESEVTRLLGDLRP